MQVSLPEQGGIISCGMLQSQQFLRCCHEHYSEVIMLLNVGPQAFWTILAGLPSHYQISRLCTFSKFLNTSPLTTQSTRHETIAVKEPFALCSECHLYELVCIDPCTKWPQQQQSICIPCPHPLWQLGAWSVRFGTTK
jgi:hypothetical protein